MISKYRSKCLNDFWNFLGFTNIYQLNINPLNVK